jgi:GT2 family glycosyltransferase
LESLYQINYPNDNVIVADNNSTNDSVEKIKEYALGNIKVQTKFTKFVDNKPIQLAILKEGEYTKIDNTSSENEKKLLLIQNK